MGLRSVWGMEYGVDIVVLRGGEGGCGVTEYGVERMGRLTVGEWRVNGWV